MHLKATHTLNASELEDSEVVCIVDIMQGEGSEVMYRTDITIITSREGSNVTDIVDGTLHEGSEVTYTADAHEGSEFTCIVAATLREKWRSKSVDS